MCDVGLDVVIDVGLEDGLEVVVDVGVDVGVDVVGGDVDVVAGVASSSSILTEWAARRVPGRGGSLRNDRPHISSAFGLSFTLPGEPTVPSSSLP